MRPHAPLAAAIVVTAMVLYPRASSGEPRLVDGVVAVVDGTAITLGQLRKRAAPFIAQVRRTQMPEWEQSESIRKIFDAALDRMIDEALFSEAAAAASIVVADSEVESTIDRAAAAVQMTRKQYFAESSAQGYSEAEVRSELRRQLLEWKVLTSAWSKMNDGSTPSGGSDAERETFAAWRKQWLHIARQNACVERKLPAPAR
jgi:peptidyl-prolyl cis-trans isomerase SurA